MATQPLWKSCITAGCGLMVLGLTMVFCGGVALVILAGMGHG